MDLLFRIVLVPLRLVARRRARHRRRSRRVRLAHRAEGIGLSDQARQLCERIGAAGVMLIAAAIIVVGGERSALISISHRRDASPTGKSPQTLAREPV